MAINTKKCTEILLQYYGLNGYKTALQNADFGGFSRILYTTAQTLSSNSITLISNWCTQR